MGSLEIGKDLRQEHLDIVWEQRALLCEHFSNGALDRLSLVLLPSKLFVYFFSVHVSEESTAR